MKIFNVKYEVGDLVLYKITDRENVYLRHGVINSVMVAYLGNIKYVVGDREHPVLETDIIGKYKLETE